MRVEALFAEGTLGPAGRTTAESEALRLASKHGPVAAAIGAINKAPAEVLTSEATHDCSLGLLPSTRGGAFAIRASRQCKKQDG